MKNIKLKVLLEDPKSIPCSNKDKVEYECPLCHNLVSKGKRYIIKNGYNCYKCNQKIARKNIDYSLLVKKQKATLIKNFGVSNPGQIKENRIKSSIRAKALVKRTGGVSLYFKNNKEECLEKRKETWLKKYGVDNPSKNSEVQKKRNRKYYYNDITFDSAWEVAFYIYHKDLGHKIIKEPCKIAYISNVDKKQHYYFPDFEVDGKLYELKGDCCKNAFIETGKLKCAIEHNITILYFEEMKPILYYVSQKYGGSYIKSFRKD